MRFWPVQKSRAIAKVVRRNPSSTGSSRSDSGQRTSATPASNSPAAIRASTVSSVPLVIQPNSLGCTTRFRWLYTIMPPMTPSNVHVPSQLDLQPSSPALWRASCTSRGAWRKFGQRVVRLHPNRRNANNRQPSPRYRNKKDPSPLPNMRINRSLLFASALLAGPVSIRRALSSWW